MPRQFTNDKGNNLRSKVESKNEKAFSNGRGKKNVALFENLCIFLPPICLQAFLKTYSK
jgi:hypothetical protein